MSSLLDVFLADAFAVVRDLAAAFFLAGAFFRGVAFLFAAAFFFAVAIFPIS